MKWQRQIRTAQPQRLNKTIITCLIACISLAHSAQAQGAVGTDVTAPNPLPLRMRAITTDDLPQSLTLISALEQARRHYPTITGANFKAEAAREGITQAKTAYLPRVDFILDENYGTANNITGFLAPQNIVPNISGLVRSSNHFQGGFGFTSGTLVSWEPFDFGLRKAHVNMARSATDQAKAQVALTQLEVEGRAADAFLSVLAAQQVVKAAGAKVERLRIFAETVRILADKEIKAKTDEYLAEAELIRSKDELIAAEQNYKIAQAGLIRWTGLRSESVEAIPGGLLKEVPANYFSVADLRNHPQAVAQKATVELVRAHKVAIDRTYAPRFYLRVPVYARGSSFNPDLSINYRHGYYPTTLNYAVSALMIFPAMDIFQLRAQKRAEQKLEQSEQSRYDEILLTLKEQDVRAKAMIEGATQIAANAPLKVKAAQEAANSARIRYRYQMASVNDVALDEQLLTQSQVEYATAQLQVWRALLASALARGDLKPFIEQCNKAYAGGN